MHFVIPRQYEAIVPPAIARWKRELVVASGVAELAGGLAVLPERTRRGARWWLQPRWWRSIRPTSRWRCTPSDFQEHRNLTSKRRTTWPSPRIAWMS